MNSGKEDETSEVAEVELFMTPPGVLDIRVQIRIQKVADVHDRKDVGNFCTL